MRVNTVKLRAMVGGAIFLGLVFSTAQTSATEPVVFGRDDPLVLARESLLPESVPGEILIELDQDVRRRIIATGRAEIRDFPLPDRSPVSLELAAFDLLAPRARFVVVDESGERDLPRPAIQAFRGTVKGDPDSLVALTFLGSRVAGFVRTWDGEFAVGPDAFNRARSGADRIRVRERDRSADGAAAFECGGVLHPDSTDLGEPESDSATSSSPSDRARDFQSRAAATAPVTPQEIDGTTLLQGTIAVDATLEFYEHFGSLSATQDYILNLLAQVSTIYENEVLIKLQVSYLRVFASEPDPYTDGSTDTSVLLADLRSEWINNKGSVDRTVTHLFSTRPSGGSGLAYLDVLCNDTYGYGVSTLAANGGSWEKNLVAHEIGHNFSSPHTHCFVPEIDYCANQDGCYQGATSQIVGTIMSYCGQKDAIFHQRVRDERIRPAAEDGYPSCLATAGLPGAVGIGAGDALSISKPAVCPSAGLLNDDGSANSYYGYGGTTRMGWIKRFTPACYPFRLTTADVMIGHTGSIAPGRPIRLLVYVDPGGSGSPVNATLVHSEDTTVQFVSAASFNSYTLDVPVVIASGDYYVGFYDLEADTPSSYIATKDTSLEGDAWQSAESTSPDAYSAHTGGTWMIRAEGGAVDPGTLLLDWEPACNEGTTPDQDYAVYGGTIGDFVDMASLTCSTSRATTWLATGLQDGSFMVVVPRTSANEGSYGLGAGGTERVPATLACRPQSVGACP